MSTRLPSLVLTAVCLAATVAAQTTLWSPNGYATTGGNGNNAFPWNWGSTPMRYQQIYSSQNFTLQSVAFPVLISRLRFRASGNGNWAGGNWPTVVINMSTAAVPFTGISTTFASNHGPNVANVYTGPVTVLPGAGGSGAPGPIYIDVQFATPFHYDPGAGDLCFEAILSGVGWTGGSTQCDAVQTNGPAGPALCRRVYNTSNHTSPTGSVDGFDYGLVTEFTYVPASGYAYASPYGTGCYNLARAAFYQSFAASTFNLGSSSIMMIPTGPGYVVIPGGTQWWTPVGNNLGLSDNAVSPAQPLGFTFPYPGGSTTNLYVSSNGFVWLQSSSDNGCCAGSPSALLAGAARVCALWTDLNPAAAGTVVFDVDAQNRIGYVTFSGVRESGTTSANTFQFAFYVSGQIEMRWQACSVTNHVTVTGWSPGGGVRDPGSVNLLTAMPFTTSPDVAALALGASARPVMGSNINLVSSNIPAGTPVGAVIFSNTQHNPGLDLGTIGMPGCRQFVGLDFNVVFPVAGTTANFALGIPSNPVLAGVRVATQAATFSTGFNPLGVIGSNGLLLVLDLL